MTLGMTLWCGVGRGTRSGRYRPLELTGYQMTCNHQAHNIHRKCTFEMSFAVARGSEEICKMALMTWSLLGDTAPDQEQHEALKATVKALMRQEELLPLSELEDLSKVFMDTGVVWAPVREAKAEASEAGANILGRRDDDCPAEVHQRMVALAAQGDIPRTTLAQRRRCRQTTAQLGVAKHMVDAKFYGYVHPNLPPPRGMRWKCLAGAWTLAPVGG